MNKNLLLDLRKPIFSNSLVGFDRLFDELFRLQTLDAEPINYPPYNVVRNGNDYVIEIAISGLSPKDIEVIVEDKSLTISYEKKQEKEEKQNILHKGIAYRSFKRQFNLAEDIEVKGATCENGLLSIQMERIIPEHKKPIKIKIK